MTDQTSSDLLHSAAGEVGREDFKVIAASSIGTVFEWFDFFLYGAMAVVISGKFFAGVDPSTGFILTLLAFAAGFAVRPVGAVIFGALGDVWGRKRTFIIALSLMGAATFAVGLLPTYAQVGVAAPWILVALRMAQGLSVGGVYGGAATYVAEHAPDDKRGLYTSWIQTTATGGTILSLIVIYAVRTIAGEAAFNDWAWRVPFLTSALLLAVTMWIQFKLNESPVYLKMKAAGGGTRAPLKEAFGNWKNLRLVLIAMFGTVIAQAVIWYAAQFYTLFFLQRVIKVDDATANLLVAVALTISAPLYVVFGWLSDKVGRKKVMMIACVIAIASYFPLFKALTDAANPAMAQAMATAPVSVYADKDECSVQFDLLGRTNLFTSSCDIAANYLSSAGIGYDKVAAPAGTTAELRVGDQVLPSFKGGDLPAAELAAKRAEWQAQAAALLKAAGYPPKADSARINMPLTILILVLIAVPAAMIYGPMAASVVEMFPTRIRYSSVSVAYHLGVGWFGGFLPITSFAIVAAVGNIYSGLWYTVGVAFVSMICGILFLPETKDRPLL